jgi:integrase
MAQVKEIHGEKTPIHEDRRYTHEEIHSLVNAADLKLKVEILLMAAAGLRLGALSTILVSHLRKIDTVSGPVYKINVYKGLRGKGHYYTFCTPECVTAIDTYLQFRERCGEKITQDSPLLRKDFDSSFHESARNQVYGVTRDSIRMDVYTCLINSGLRTVDRVNPIRNRKEVKMTHGFRKFFETMLVNAGIHETIIRKLTGHSDNGNLTQLYSKQTEEEMFLEYEKAIDALTINPENRLKRKVEKLEVERSQFEALAAEIQEIKKAIKSS